MVPKPLLVDELSQFRGQPDIPGPNWNNSELGPNTNVGFTAKRGPWWKPVSPLSCL